MKSKSGNLILLSSLLSVGLQAAPSPSPFLIGERIETGQSAAVFVNPPTAGAYAGRQTLKAQGRVVAGPVRAADVAWWKVDFDTSVDGWVAQRDLRKAGGALPPDPRGPTPVPPDSTGLNFHNLNLVNGMVLSGPKTRLSGTVRHESQPAADIRATVNGKPLALDARGNFNTEIELPTGNAEINLRATTSNPRQQVTKISTFIDASMVYGSDTTRANALRTFSGGLLKTSAGNLPPLNTAGLENANDAHIFPDSSMFLAGDIRANENLELTSLHTLFLREHNQLASAIAVANPKLTDEQIYQRARRLVMAEVQSVTYQEFLPAMLGANALRPYQGYRSDVNPGLATEFSTAGFRVGHTLINDDIQFLDNEGVEARAGLALAFAFFNPAPLKQSGPDGLLKYLATDNTQEVDPQLVEGLRNFLFGPPGAGGLDLASINIQRGRDHGLPDYNTVRVAYGLPRVTSIAQVTSDAGLQVKLLSLYGSVDSMDLWVAGLAEDHLAGSSVGPTFQKIIAHQFERTRDGDANWYERSFSGRQLAALRATKLSDIIRRNTSLTKIQDNVFFFDEEKTLVGLTAKAGFLPPDLVQGPGSLGPVPSLDGKGNNLAHPMWGAAGANLLRVAGVGYADGISTPAGENRANPRLISNTVGVLTTDLANARQMASYVYAWGQFIDHDLGLTTTGDTSFNISIPKGDASFDPFSTGTQVIPLNRSNYDVSTGTTALIAGQKTVKVVVQLPPPPKPPKK
ncbi:MAG: peroxidase family protein [Verrucomicrobiota bacterium]